MNYKIIIEINKGDFKTAGFFLHKRISYIYSSYYFEYLNFAIDCILGNFKHHAKKNIFFSTL